VKEGSESCCSSVTSAGKSPNAHLLFWIVAIITAAADLASKWWAFKYIRLDEIISVVPNFLFFKNMMNKGAVFGLGSGKRWLFVVASAVAIVFILQLFAQSRSRQRILHVLLALTLGGAMGNLYDRLAYGHVRDFIYMYIGVGGFELWPFVFNVADVALVIGVFGLLLGWLTGKFDIGGSYKTARPVFAEQGGEPLKPE